MTIVIPPGYGHVDISFRHSAYQRDAHCTFGVADAGSTPDPATVVREAWIAAGSMGQFMDSNVSIVQVRVTIGQDGGDPTIDVNNEPFQGPVSRDSTTAALAVLFTKRTAFGGRRGTGRMFVPWFVGDNQVSETGILDAGIVPPRTSGFNTLIEELGTEGMPMVLLGRTGISPVPPPRPVLSGVCSNVISTQRRRQVRNP